MMPRVMTIAVSDARGKAPRAAVKRGERMARRESVLFLFVVMLVLAAALPANAQSFRVQCPTFTITHPDPATTSNTTNNGNPYNGPTQFTTPTTGTAQWAVPT